MDHCLQYAFYSVLRSICLDPEFLPVSGITVPDPDPAKNEIAD